MTSTASIDPMERALTEITADGRLWPGWRHNAADLNRLTTEKPKGIQQLTRYNT